MKQFLIILSLMSIHILPICGNNISSPSEIIIASNSEIVEIEEYEEEELEDLTIYEEEPEEDKIIESKSIEETVIKETLKEIIEETELIIETENIIQEESKLNINEEIIKEATISEVEDTEEIIEELEEEEELPEEITTSAFWYIENNVLHLSSIQPTNANYKIGQNEYNSKINIERNQITEIKIDNKLYPQKNCSNWFKDFLRLEKINSLSNIDFTNVNSISGMFNNCKNIKEIDFSYCNLSNVENMNKLFYKCEKLEKINFKGIDTYNLQNASSMFNGCKKLKELDLTEFYTNKLENVERMFSNCNKLEKIIVSDTFNTENIKFSDNMFYGDNKLPNYDIDNIDLSNCLNYVTIQYSPTYTVYFNTNGGNTINSINAKKYEKLSRPNNPIKEGYIFENWYKDSTYTDEYDFENSYITKSITLYADYLYEKGD